MAFSTGRTLAICISLVFSLSPIKVSSEGITKWFSQILQDGTSNFSERAVSIAMFEEGTFIVAVERILSASVFTVPVLYKVTLSGTVLWARVTQGIMGTPHQLVVDRKRKIAYVTVSSTQLSTSPHTGGFVIRFQGLSKPTNSEGAKLLISEEMFFSTDLRRGSSKLFACALDIDTGDIFVTGGATRNLYGISRGRSDVIALRIGASGIILASAQFGSEHEEFGRAIAISSNCSVIAVSVFTMLENGGSESALYRLHAKSLAVIDGPATLPNFGAIPFFAPADIAVSQSIQSGPASTVTVICGRALTVPDHRTDAFLHVYARVNEANTNIAVYVDGAVDQKKDDYAVAVEAGNDGNIYSIGYTEDGSSSAFTAIILVVISPLGEILYRSERKGRESDGNRSVPTAMIMFHMNDKSHIAYTGYALEGDNRKAIIGTASLPADIIPIFKGFGDIVKGAGVDPVPKPPKNDDKSLLPILPIALAAVVGTFILLAGIVALLLLRAKRRTRSSRQNNREVLDECMAEQFSNDMPDVRALQILQGA